MKEETTEIKHIHDDKDLSKLLSYRFCSNEFLCCDYTLPIIRYVPVHHFYQNIVKYLVCSLCKRCDDNPEKYGEKITLQQHNLTVHYFCLVSQTLMMCIYATNLIFESLSSFPVKTYPKVKGIL